MQHSVYLQGALGERFGNKFIVNTDNYRDIFRCINANRPDFLPYIRECHQENVEFIIETAGEQVDQEDLLLPLKKGDITIAIAPVGSKSGVQKVLAAIAIIFIMTLIPAGSAGGNLLTAKGLEGAALVAQKVGYALATNLALSGVQQMMAPDPAVDQDSPTNYLFTGQSNNQIEGDPIPLLYGELRVPGRPIAIDIIQGGVPITNNVVVGSDGSENAVGSEEVAEQATIKEP